MQVLSYDLDLAINDEDYSFTGKEQIKLISGEKEISLDCVDINIGGVSVDGSSSEFSLSGDHLSIILPGSGEHIIEISFEGAINQNLTGLYLAKTAESDMFTTQFESTGARRVFPCIDDPGYKAEFGLTLNISRELEAISNMPLKNQSEKDGRKRVEFEKTPRMSTYLLYIGIGKFDHKSAKHGNVDVILTAPRGHLSPSNFPLEVAVKCIEKFEEYFGINYMLPKMHLISVPEFGAGAMENWGALTFREILLYADDKTGSQTLKMIAAVIAHEIAHQWFGDLVTMKWWNDLWLNESFATFMAYKMVDELYPEMDGFGELISTRTSGALTDDALINSHPIDVDVRDPNSVAQIFDQISYGKGASVLRMIEHFVGKEDFRDGIREYLKKHSYSNSRGSDLWNSIEEASGKPVNRIMEAWIKKQGYPYIHVSRQGDMLELEQKRFLFNADASDEWPIPMTLVTSSSVESAIMDTLTMSRKEDGFVKVNSDNSGFYRVLYEKDVMEGVLSRLDQMTHLDRWGIVSDMYAFLLADLINLDTYLDAIEHLENERHHLVLREVSSQLLRLHMKAPENDRLRSFAHNMIRTFIKMAGAEKVAKEDMNLSILRGNLFRSLAILDQEFASGLSGKFQQLESLDPDIKGAVILSYALTENDFEGLVNAMEASKKDEDKTIIIGALGWLKEKADLESANRLVLDGRIKRQDCMAFFSSLASCPTSREFSFEHLEETVEFLKKTFAGSRRSAAALESIVPLVGMGRVDQMKILLERLRSPETEKGILKGLELLEINERFRAKYNKS